MPTIKKLNPDNAKANAKVKNRPAKNRRAGVGAVAYMGTAIEKTPAQEQKRRLKEAIGPTIPLAVVGGAAMYSLVKNSKR